MRVFRSFIPEPERSFSTPKTERIARRRIYRQPAGSIDRHLFYVPTPKDKSLPGISRSTLPMMALLIAAHNEELVLGKTIKSAIEAGMKAEHIYVVDDNSSDRTSTVATNFVPVANVIKVQRSGKGLALTKAARRFKLAQRYRWIHIADADGAFAPNYFKVFRRELRIENAAATGYIRSLPGKRISEYRVYEYTVGMEIHRRLQTLLNVVPVIPGPTSCFRADVFAKVNFDNKSLTEDFDVTIQLHRKKLGKIQFIPGAVAYTQDPKSLQDYTKQIQRWNRGGLQSMVKYKIGRRVGSIDAYLGYQIMQNLLFFASYLLWVPYLAISRGSWAFVAAAFVIDVFVTFMITLLTALRTKRFDVLSAFPQVYVLRWVSLAIFLQAFVEVIILKKFRTGDGKWENHSTRRYIMDAQQTN
jgi:cellulose synthase/poly-beta-1,6-N-acetylglucosamine synthase-like glycosyltransferase